MPWRAEAYQNQVVSGYGKRLLELLRNRLQKPHEELWDNITPDEAPFVRDALVKAQERRSTNADPGDTLLEGYALGLEARRTIASYQIPSPKSEDGMPQLRLIVNGGYDGAASPPPEA
jgi:hypothetical protein